MFQINLNFFIVYEKKFAIPNAPSANGSNAAMNPPICLYSIPLLIFLPIAFTIFSKAILCTCKDLS